MPLRNCTGRADCPACALFAEDASPEPCAGCGDLTLRWSALPDRTPGEQVALCPLCAARLSPADVPSKADWIAAQRAKRSRHPARP